MPSSAWSINIMVCFLSLVMVYIHICKLWRLVTLFFNLRLHVLVYHSYVIHMLSCRPSIYGSYPVFIWKKRFILYKCKWFLPTWNCGSLYRGVRSGPRPVFSYKLRYIVGFWLVEILMRKENRADEKPTQSAFLFYWNIHNTLLLTLTVRGSTSVVKIWRL